MTQTLQQENITVQIKKHRRSRSPKLLVKPDCSVTLVIPYGMRAGYCEEFITRYRPWIEEKVALMRHQYERVEQILETHSDEILLFGRWITLERADFDVLDENRLGFKNENSLKRLLRNRLKEEIESRCDLYAGRMEVRYGKIGIRKTKNRWGSCGRAGDLSFSSMLVFAPKEIIEYLIVHELSHIRHKNHSRHFWDHVARFHPGYKEAEVWIRENHHLLQRLSHRYL